MTGSAVQRDRAYTHDELVALVAPRSIAIAGISPREGSFGLTTLANLSTFGGRVHLVNPRHARIADRDCHPSISALPEVPDCLVIAAGRDSVESLVRDGMQAGVRACIVYAAGYAETGKPERIEMQHRLGELARAGGMRIAGPNCLGMVNYVHGAVVSFSAWPDGARPPGRWVGIASQSGGMANSLSQMLEQGTPVGMALGAGNSADVDVADLIAYLAAQPDCGVIVSTFEGVPSGPRLLHAMQCAWRADKPLLIYKMATGGLGAQAAASHTGSLAGSDAAYRAAFERHGVVAVNEFESLVEAAQFFLKARAPKATGVAALNTSGGATVMSADKAEAAGVDLPQPSDAVQAIVAARIPDYGSARNPYDMTAQMLTDPGAFPLCADALMSDPAFGAVTMTTAWSSSKVAERSRVLADAAARHGKIACNVWLSPWLDGPGSREAQLDANMALFRSMDRCFATLAAWHRRGQLRAQHDARGAGHPRLSAPEAMQQAQSLLQAAPGPVIGERDAKAVLACYGVPVIAEQLVRTAAQAVDAAQALGWPVALKVDSPDLPHKTEAGVVRLRLRSAEEVRQAYEEVMANARRHGGDGVRVRGVLVQPMAAAGVEVVVGARVDPQFGPLVVVGLGGILVELLQDSAIALAPVTQDQALGMLQRLKGRRLLEGFRGAAPVDTGGLAQVVVRVSEFAADHAHGFSELDINPLICAGDHIVAVDALIIRGTDRDGYARTNS